MKKTNKDLQRFIATRLRRPLDKVQTMTAQSIINAVKDETLFRCVECGIHVPEHLRDHFQEMCPIFKNVEISCDDIGGRKRYYERTLTQSHREYDWREDPFGDPAIKMVFRAWFRGKF